MPIAGATIHIVRAGSGKPLLVLHHDIGTLDRLPFYDALAGDFTVLVPSHPGYDKSERPAWLRSVRDVAIVYQGLLAQRGLTDVTLVGLGFGGWIAAEMATMAPGASGCLVLVGAMGIKPEAGTMADQALLSYIDYVRLGFADQAVYDRIFGAQTPTPTLEQWDLNREMTFRIAWKPYMYNPSLPPLLGSVTTPTLIVWGRHDRIVPLECGERYVKALPNARLEVLEGAGHFAEMEMPGALASLVTGFAKGVQKGSEKTPCI